MKSLSKKLLVALLSVGMVVTMIPFTAFPAEAATNLDGGFQGMDADVFTALGFDVTELPEGYDPDTTDNPFGRDKITGNQVFELAVAGQNGSKIYGKGDNNVKASSISGIPGGNGIGMELFSSAAGDFDGDGLAGEIIYVGYESIPVKMEYNDSNIPKSITTDSAKLQLRVYNGRTETYGEAKEIETVNVLDTYLNKYDSKIEGSYALEYMVNGYDAFWQNLLQVSAGDYDGDGISEIAVYVPQKGSPRIDVYKYQKNSSSTQGDWIDLDNWKRVWSHALGGEYVPNMVSLVSGDFNRDGIDDLGISFGSAVFTNEGLSSTKYAFRIDASQAVMLWGDREKSLQNSFPIDLNTGELGAQARVSLIKGDLDQDGVEELIATGQPAADLQKYGNGFWTGDKYFYEGNTQRTILTYVFDQDAGLLINSSDLMKPVDGQYETATISDGEGNNTTSTQWKSGNGFDDKLYSEPYMRTNAAVFRAMGADYPYLYMDSCLYQYSNGALTLLGEMDEKYDGQHSIKDADPQDPSYAQSIAGHFWGSRTPHQGEYEQGYYAEYGAGSADINGAGYGILATNSFQLNSKVYERHITQYAVVTGTADGKLKATITNPEGDVGNTAPEATKGYEGVALTFLDCDIDTIIMEYTGQHYLTYSDPKVLAVIAAAPYFEDVDEATGYEFAGNNTTSWGKTHGDSTGESVSVSVEFGAWAENTIATGTGQISLNGGLVYTLEWEKTRTVSHEYTMTFGTYGDQDAVAFYSIPTENYVYRVYVPNDKNGYDVTSYQVSNTFDPAYQVLTLDYYESIQKNYDALPAIRGKAITSTPGDPASYPSSTSGYKVITQWDRDAAGVGYGNGSIEQEISISAEEEISYSMGAEFSFELGGGLSAQVDLGQNKYESTGGMQFAINPAGGWSETNMKGTTIAAEVANMPVEFQQYGYYFDWKLFSYYYTFGDTDNEETLEFETMEDEDDQFTVDEDIEIGEATSARIPVISYIVNNVSKPPTLPDDFQQDYDRTTSDSNVMTWTYDSPCTAFIISKYFDFPVGGGIQQIARIEPGDADHYQIKYDEDGKPYKEFFFTDTNLSPYTEYEYAIQVERLVPPPPLSTPSALTPARTKAEDGYPNINITESDEEQDGKLLVYPDKNAYLTAGVTGPEGENINNYYSVVQYQWQKKNKGAWEDMVGETNKTLTFASAGVDTAGDYRCRVNVITKAGNVAITAYSNSVELTHAKRTSYMKEVSVTDVAGGGIQLYAEVANAHKDSASIPGGSVTFNLISNSTGETYMYIQPLSAAGIATAVVDQELPEGMYSVKAYYAGSYIFKSCTGEALYLSQRATGYDIDLPNSVTYGDEAQIVFREVSKTGGVTSTRDVNADTTTMYLAAPLSRAALSGAEVYGSSAVKGTKYYYTDTDGVRWFFTAPADGAAKFENGYALFGDDLAASAIKAVPGKAGNYLLQAGTAAGVYRITMKASGAEETAAATIEVHPRPITVQIPTNLTAGEDETAAAEDILVEDLALINGSWADCDISNEAFKYAKTSIGPEYYNTAGTKFTAANVRKLCGAYSVIGTTQLDNYQIIYRSGQLTILGAAYTVNIGARPFDGLNVGKVYMMAPEIGVATGELGTSKQLTKQIQAGVRMVFSAQPDNGYEIYDWYINGKSQGNKSSTLVYTQLAEDVDVEVQFAIKQNSLTFGTAGDENGGTLTPDPSLTSGSVIRQNSRFTFTAEAKEGYHFKEWRYTEQGLGTVYDDEDSGKMGSTYDFYMPNNSCSLYAVFERDGYIFNYIDGNNANGLTATYENEEGKTVTAKSGSAIKGGTVITVAPASGYDWDSQRQYVSQGTQGTEDRDKGTYTLKLDQDTTVYGWTIQKTYDLTLGYELARFSQQVPDASITYYIGDQEYTFTCAEYLPNRDKVIRGIPGGTPISATVDAPSWVDLKGWTSSETKLTSDAGGALLGTEVTVDGTVRKNKTYNYTYTAAGGGTSTYHFTSPVNGTVRSLDGENVILYAASTTYTIPALGQDETLKVGLKEKPVHTVTMADISENGSYNYELPAGGFNGETENIVKVHDGDELTVAVIPKPGKTVSYWKTSWKDGAKDLFVNSPATSLRYTIPNIVTDYGFEPIFSASTYNLISWPTISESQNGLSLDPESGYISSVTSGKDFKFKLSGDSLNLVDKVFANGNEFTIAGNKVGDTTYKVENGVYSITKVTGNQEITVKLKNIGVTVNGVDINAMSGVGWTYDSGTQTLTLNRSGLNLSGTNDQNLAPALKIVTTGMVGSLTLESLEVTSASSETLLSLAADTIITANGNSILKNSVKARSVYAAQDLTFRGNGSLEVEGFSNASAPTVETDRNLTLLGTMELIIKSNRSVGKTNIGLVTHDLTIGADGIETVSPVLRVSADSNSKSGYAVSADNVTIYGGEASFTGTNEETYGLIFQGNVDCYGGILEVSSPSKRALWKAGDGEVRAFYPDGYMCRYAVTSQQSMFDENEPQVTYTSYAKLAAAYDNGKYDIVEGTDIDFKKQIYVRLSPMSGNANGDNLTLSVEYNGKTYSRSVKEDTDGSGYYYYIDVSDDTESTEPKELKALRYQDSYTVFNNPNDTGHTDIEEDDIIVAENDVASGSNLYFNIMRFQKGDALEGNIGYRYTVVWPTDSTKVEPLDYTISGSVSGSVDQASRGSINANGAIGFRISDSDYSRVTNDIKSLTMADLTHVNVSVGNYPVYLKGDNYLIGSSVNTVPLSVPVGDVDLRSDGNGTLTISTASGTYGKALGLQNGHLKLTDVASLTLISDRGALSSLGVTYKHGEGDAAVALPYGLGWLEDVGDKAGNAVTQNEVVSLTDTQQYVRIYTTSTDAKATLKKLVYDKSTPESTPTVSKVTLTPPTVMGNPHLFTPEIENSGSKVELYKGSEKLTDLTTGTDYVYVTDSNDPIIGELTMTYSGNQLKNLAVGEYTIRVFFQDEDTTDATYYSLDIPLTVQDTAHVVGELIVVDPDTPVITLTRGSSKNITTKFTGTTPKTYDWSIAAVDAGGATEGISLPADTHGAANTVSVGNNAKNGKYKITVASYADETKTQKLGEAAVDLTVVPKAEAIAISCATETPSGDESYMLNHNTLDSKPKAPWDFDVAVTMDDRSKADPAKVSWSLWGGTMTGTAVDRDGKLTINPNETGLMNSGYLLLTATYTNEDGTKLAKSIKIRLSEDAIVGYTPGTAETGGTISAAQVTNAAGTPIPKNTEVTFTAAPETDYAVDTWYINGQPVEEGVDGNTMTFTTEKMGRYSVWATFAKEKNYVVTYEKTGAGTITAETENGTLASGDKVAGGTDVTFTAVPDSFHKVSAWYVDGEKQEREPTETLTLPKINKDVNVKVEFTVPDRTITITSGEHGSITFLVDGVILADPVTEDNGKYTLRVPANRTVTALAVPEENYSVDQWSNLESATAADAICTIPRGMEDAKATVSFKGQVQHKVTVYTNSFENGAGIVEVGSDIVPMSGSKTFPVAEGGSLVLTAVPDAGSTLNDWTVEPESYKDYTIDGNMLTLTNVTEDVEAKATFHRSSNKLTLIKEGDGVLTADYKLKVGENTVQEGLLTASNEGTANETIRSGATVVVTVTPADGQIPSTFTVNGEDKSAELVKDPNEVKYTYQIGALTEDTEIKAVFEEMVRYDVTGHADYTVQEPVEPADPEAVPTTTEKTIGTVVITEFGAGNGFNEVTGADPQKVSVIPNTPIEITFIPADGYLVNTEALSAGVAELLPENSNIRFSFKQSATGTILVLEGIDADLDLSQLDNPFKPKDPEVDFVKLQLINNNTDYGTLTAKTANDDTAPIQYVPGEQIEIPAGTQLTYKAEPKEHFKASVTVNGAVSDEKSSLTVNEDTVICADFEQSKYKVTITTLGKGTGSVTINNEAYDPGEYWLEAGRELSIAAVAAKGSGVSSFTVDGTAVTEGSETVTLDKDIAVIAAFSDTMRTVTYNSPANGKLQVLDAEGKNVESGTSVPIGSKLYIVKTPDAHYTLKTLTVGGTELSGDYFVVDEERGNNVYCEFTRAEDKVTWIAVYGSVDAQIMPEGESISNGEYVPAGSQIKFVVKPKNSNYSLESLTVNGKAMSPSNYYEADQEDVEAVAICEYTGDVPGVKEGVKVSMLPVNCTMTAQLEDGTAVKNGDYVKTGDKIKFTHKPTKSDYTLDKFTVIGAEADKNGMYVAGSEDIIASAVYNAPSTTIINEPDVPLAPDATYTVLIDAGDGGHVDVTIKNDPVKSGAEVDLGSKLTIKAVPDEGRQVKTLTVNGVKFNNGEEYVVYANTLIKAEFEEATTETGLPCYKDDRGSTVYSGFSYDLNGDGVYTEDEYIIPKDVEVHFQENHKYFEDMPGNWADEYIQFVGDREIFQGVTDTLFDPEGKVTRAMYVTVIGRLYERSFGTINGGTAKNFTDCDYDSWYGKYVDWAAATGVVNGYDEKTFGPNDNVTREQMAAILTRFAKLMKLDTKAGGSLSFTDMDTISDYAVDSVRYCVDKGIITGYEDGRFAPQDNATRAQIAAVIVRYIESVLSE